MVKSRIFNYDSLEDFLRSIDRPRRSDCPYSPTETYSFTRSNSFEDAMRIARYGVDLGSLDKAIQLSEKFEETYQMQAEHGVSGAVVDIGRYLEGEPENMIDFPVLNNMKYINIVVNFWEPGYMDASIFINKAIAVAHAVDHLENNGYRVNLTAIAYCYHGKGQKCTDLTVVNIKKYQEKMAIGQISGALHPSFMRRLLFRHQEHFVPELERGYGLLIRQSEVSSNYKGYKEMLAEVFTDPYVYLPGTDLGRIDLSTPEKAVNWVNNHINNEIRNGKLAE